DRRQRHISPAVENDVYLARNQTTIASHARPVTNHTGGSLGGGSYVFGAIVDHLHRTAGFVRKQRCVSCEHRRILFFAAKPSTRRRLDDNGLFVAQIEELLERLVNVVGALHRTHYRHLIAAWYRDHPL